MILRVSYDDVDQMGADSGGGIIYYYKGQPFTGIIEEIVNGILVGESEFTDGHIGGIQRHYHPNGKMNEEYTIRFNKLEGAYHIWDESGNLIRQSHWKDGIQIT